MEQSGTVGNHGLYLVMPLLEGTTLGQILHARGPAPEALLLAVRRACEGIAHAHARGVVHRDLKPSNIQVEPDGLAVILDWGLACRAGRSPHSGTRLVGTPLYMAPEQVQGGPVTPQTDVYALGAVLYEMITGRHPAGPAGDLEEIFARICGETPPPPSVLVGDVAKGLDEIVMRSLEKDSADRFANAADLLDALEEI